MSTLNTLPADNTNQAGFPPAPSEALQKAVVEIASDPKKLQLLDPVSQEKLAEYGLTLKTNPMVPGAVRVFDALGQFRFCCTEGVSPFDLDALLVYGGERYFEGEREGLRATTRRVLETFGLVQKGG